MVEVKYICTGSCGGAVTEKDFKKGKNTCQATQCEKKGKPLEKRNYCSSCDEYFKEKEKHSCA